MFFVPLGNHFLQNSLKLQKGPGWISSKEDPGCGNVQESCGDWDVGLCLIHSCDAEKVRTHRIEIAESKKLKKNIFFCHRLLLGDEMNERVGQ